MAHLVGSTTGFGDTAHKITHPQTINPFLQFLIVQMRGGILFALAHDNKVSRICMSIYFLFEYVELILPQYTIRYERKFENYHV